jgi:hypothetical protein
MTLEEEMVMAVLRGDMVAAKALVDILTDKNIDIRSIPPVKQLIVNVDRIKALVIMREGHPLTQEKFDELGRGIREWLREDNRNAELSLITLHGVERVELYEILNRAPSTHEVQGYMNIPNRTTEAPLREPDRDRFPDPIY